MPDAASPVADAPSALTEALTRFPPSKWVANGHLGGAIRCDGSTVVMTSVQVDSTDHGPALLRLFAAAPQLLAALKGLLSAHGEQIHDACDQAQRAIHAAEG